MTSDASGDRRVLGLIPARGGSKGVPRKNVRELGGRPLIVWTIESARRAEGLTSVVVSTDDPEIARVAEDAGAEVPFLRPAELATDTTPTLAVMIDALDRLAADGREFDAVCLLQPTTPFRPADLVDRAVDELFDRGADSVVSVSALPFDHHPDWALVRGEDGFASWATGRDEPPTRRQDLRPAYHRDGSLYVTRTSVLRAGSLYGARMVTLEVEAPTVNIDTPDDWARAEQLAGAHGADG
jgi:N-acylneuraminate cytidylyltransferase